MHVRRLMTETELDLNGYEEKQRKLHFEWLAPAFIQPKRTFETIARQEKGVWLTPLLVLSVLALFMIFAGGPMRLLNTEMNQTIPESFQWMTEEQQAQYLQSLEDAKGPLFIYVLPAVGALAGVWLGWLVLGSVLHLSLTLNGSRSTSTASLNIAAWASLPLAIRYLVQAVYLLISKTLIQKAGLSGFIPADSTGIVTFIGYMLAFVDLFLVWQVVLLILGAGPVSGMPRGKVLLAVFAAVLVALILFALPGFISSQLSGLSSSQSFYFF